MQTKFKQLHYYWLRLAQTRCRWRQIPVPRKQLQLVGDVATVLKLKALLPLQLDHIRLEKSELLVGSEAGKIAKQ